MRSVLVSGFGNPPMSSGAPSYNFTGAPARRPDLLLTGKLLFRTGKDKGALLPSFPFVHRFRHSLRTKPEMEARSSL
jgi:hypothetical protein